MYIMDLYPLGSINILDLINQRDTTLDYGKLGIPSRKKCNSMSIFKSSSKIYYLNHRLKSHLSKICFMYLCNLQ